MTLVAFLTQSPTKKRWYYAVQSFVEQTITGLDGKSYVCLAPKGNNDTRALPPDSITSVLLPIELNSKTRAQMEKIFPSTAEINTSTGELIISAQQPEFFSTLPRSAREGGFLSFHNTEKGLNYD